MTQINKIGLIALLLVISIGNVQAESGNITVEQLTTGSFYGFGGAGDAVGTANFSVLYWDTVDFNYISSINFAISSTGLQSEYTRGTITSGGTGGLTGWYDRDTLKVYVVPDTDATMTSSPLTLSWDKNIWANVSMGANSQDGSIAISKPIGFKSTYSGRTYYAATYNYVLSSRTTDYYIITYPVVGGTQKFLANITKGTLSTKHIISNQSGIITTESSFNILPYQYLGTYTNGLYINVTLVTGSFTKVLINSSGTSGTPGTSSISITTDKANYQRGNTITITAINSGTSSVYLTGYGPTGIMTDLLWNELVTAGQTKVINKVIQNDYPIGTYQINAATTMSYSPLVAVTYFNITLPTNTSNTLGLLWGDFLYSTGSTGTINAQGGFNASTLTITSPASIITTHSLISNQTASYSLTLNENGVWSARLVDNGNASNNIISNTTASPGNPSDNATFDTCKGQTTYICFNHPTYFRGDSFSLAYQSGFVILPVNLSITITAPSGKVTTLAKAPGTSGIVQGTIPLDAEIGTYWAKLVRPDDSVLNPGEVLAEGYTAVEAQLITPTPTNTPPTSADIINTSKDLLMLFAQIAFYGLVIFVGIMFGLVKAGIQGSALLVMGGFIATFEALAGLFGGFGIYVIIITWIILAVYFRLGRDMTTGGE